MENNGLNICIVLTRANIVSETFIAAHIELLRSVNCVLHQSDGQPAIAGNPVLSQSFASRLSRKLSRAVRHAPWQDEVDRGYAKAFYLAKSDVVLAEYGVNGVLVMEACKKSGVPLVVHFHGYDASRYDVLKLMESKYRRMFDVATACIVVSRVMEQSLLRLGCPQEKLVYFPCGVDFSDRGDEVLRGDGKRLVAVGRFVEKKAPHLTIIAFARILERFPDAHLTMIGDGPLLPICRQISAGLGVGDAVRFLGAQPHTKVEAEMQLADIFVQHSTIASDGDSEGTPVAVLEAGSMGLPVVATRHAGIPDVVIDGQTGLLCKEGDVDAMAENVCKLLAQKDLRRQMGSQASRHVRRYYTLDKNISRLQLVLDAAARGNEPATVKREIEESLPDNSKIVSAVG